MEGFVGKEIGGGEKRGRSPPVVADHGSKKPRRSDLVEESVVQTEEPEIDIESIVETDEEPKVHFPMPDKKEDAYIIQIMKESFTFQRGLKWIVYRLMVGEDDKEKFISSVESLKKDYDKENSLIDLFEGPPRFVMVAMEANTLEAKAKSGVGISEIVDRFYGVSDIFRTSNQAKVTARLLFFKLEVLYLLNRKKIQRLAAAQHCAINIYTSGYPSCDTLLGHEDIIVDVEEKRQNVCTTLVNMFLCVYEEFRHLKQLVHSMDMRMRNLPFTGLLHEVYIHGRQQKMMASYKDGKEMMSPDYLFLGKPYLSVLFQLGYAYILTREEGKLINDIRGPSEAEFEVNLTDCGRGSVKLVIAGKSAGLVTNAMDLLVKKLKCMGDVDELGLAAVLVEKQCCGNDATGYFVGCWLTEEEEEEEDEDEDEDAW